MLKRLTDNHLLQLLILATDTLRELVRTSAPPPDVGRVMDLGCGMCRVGNVYEQ